MNDRYCLRCVGAGGAVLRHRGWVAWMSNVRQMPGSPLPTGSIVPQTVDLLEELLAKAKAGEIQSVAVAWTNGGGDVYSKWAHNKEWWVLVGAATQLVHRMAE